MAEDQIERRIELRIDAADRALMKGSMNQLEYDAHVKQINKWADDQYAALAKFLAKRT